MMFFKRLLITGTFLVLTLSLTFAGGPWTQKKSEGIVYGNITPVIYKSRSSATGDGVDLTRRVTEVTTQIYAEHGLSDRFLLMGNMALNYVGTSRKIFTSTDFISPLAQGRTFGMGNSSIGMKYRFTSSDRKMLFSGSFQVEFPGSNEIDVFGLRTGYDAWTFLPGIHFGNGYASGIYFFIEGQFGVHTQISDEYRINGEFGYNFKKPLVMAVTLTVKESLKNRTPVDSPNYLQTGLYLNNQEFIAWSFKFFYEASETFGVTTALSGGIRTERIARTPVISAGLYYKWKQKSED